MSGSTEPVFSSSDSAGQRKALRLYLVELALEHAATHDVAAVIADAAKMEAYVTGEAGATPS